ncbi:MAG: hypothetical protein NTW28_03015 [Candidatus Solibacter sp.]|nr:hypothetical protein [Candidatus Solibacter sp.]
MNQSERERMFEELFRTREYYIARGGIWIGCNLIIASHWPDMTLSNGISAIALTTATPFAVTALGRRIRGRRFEKECRPLIDRLESLLKTMEEDRV